MHKFRPSKHLNEEENIRLDVLQSCLRVAPLSATAYARYVDLCQKAHRKAKPNW